MQESNFNKIAENIIYNFLTDPNIDEKIEELKKIPMTCSRCNTKGLVQISEPRIKQYSFGGYFDGKLVDTTLIDYICPNCGQKWIKYNHHSGGGIIEKELSYFD